MNASARFHHQHVGGEHAIASRVSQAAPVAIIFCVFAAALTGICQAGRRSPAATWTNVTGNLGGGTWGYRGVGVLQVLPPSGEVIAAVSGTGLWSNKAGGSTWSAMGTPGQITNVPSGIIVDPQDPRTFWETGSSLDGIYKTTDGGASFVHVGSIVGVDDLAIDFGDPGRRSMVATIHHATRTLMVTVSSGLSWTNVADNLPVGCNEFYHPIALDDRTFVVDVFGSSPANTGVFRTWDSGHNWIRTYAAAVDRATPPRAAADGTIYKALAAGGVVKSTNKGITWQRLPGLSGTAPITLPGGDLVGVAGKQLYISRDGGKTSRAYGPVMPFQPISFVYSPTLGYFIWQWSATHIPDAVFRWKPA